MRLPNSMPCTTKPETFITRPATNPPTRTFPVLMAMGGRGNEGGGTRGSLQSGSKSGRAMHILTYAHRRIVAARLEAAPRPPGRPPVLHEGDLRRRAQGRADLPVPPAVRRGGRVAARHSRRVPRVRRREGGSSQAR